MKKLSLALFFLFFSVNIGLANGRMFMYNSNISESDLEKMNCQAEFALEKSTKIYAPGESIVYTISSPCDLNVRNVMLRILRHGVRTEIFNKEHSLVSGVQTANVPVIKENGAFILLVEWIDENGVVLKSYETGIGVIPKNSRSKDDFLWGLESRAARLFDWGENCIIRGQKDDQAYLTLMGYIDDSGVNFVREGSSYENVALEHGKNYYETMDKLVGDLSKRNIVFNWVIAGTPKWAVRHSYRDREEYQNDNHWRLPPDINEWKQFIASIANEYKGKNILYEIYNEPNVERFHKTLPGFWLGTSSEYFEVLEAGVNGICGIDPSARVINGGMVIDSSYHYTHDEDGSYYDFFQNIPGNSSLYAIAIHSHGTINTLRTNWENIKTHINSMYQNKIILNESGDDGENGKRTWDERATQVVGKAIWAKAHGFAGYSAFSLGAVTSNDDPDAFGMISRDLESRPSFLQYMYAIRILSEASLQRILVENEVEYAYLFSRGQAEIAVFIDTTPEKVGFDTKGYVAYDAFGNPLGTNFPKGILYYIKGEIPNDEPDEPDETMENKSGGCKTGTEASFLLLLPILLCLRQRN